MKYLLPLIIAFGLYGCQIMSNEDWFDLINNEHDPDPAVIDTCTSYQTITSPLFVSYFAKLDTSEIVKYEYNGNQISLSQFLSAYGSVSLYESTGSVAGIITGYENASFLNHVSLYAYDGSGTRAKIGFYAYGFHFIGTLTFDQFYDELVLHPSVQLLTLYNSVFTCDQVEKIFAFLLEDCKAPPKDIYCLTYINQNGCDSQLLQDQLDELQLRGSTIHN